MHATYYWRNNKDLKGYFIQFCMATGWNCGEKPSGITCMYPVSAVLTAVSTRPSRPAMVWKKNSVGVRPEQKLSATKPLAAGSCRKIIVIKEVFENSKNMLYVPTAVIVVISWPVRRSLQTSEHIKNLRFTMNGELSFNHYINVSPRLPNSEIFLESFQRLLSQSDTEKSCRYLSWVLWVFQSM